MRVYSDFHAIAVADEYRWDYLGTREWKNRISARTPDGGLEIYTGVHDGYVEVTAIRAETAPAIDLDSWEVVGEMSIFSEDGSLEVRSREGDPFEQESLAQGPGWYRIRVSARGRDRHFDQAVLESGEEYEIVAWSETEFRMETNLKAADHVSVELSLW
ncbi:MULTISPECIES: hypothetical protein [unclassified Rathayibacter]|uniref:hypothetical protein n=1 Tax=unclassified Rathayibacter TaxID=2609250 RepID=UPI00188A4A6D|nr:MULTISPECIES: hypothetical protein [unclassified Rathayibacter]MBF4461806.1 hypothetical protein [Rathayibacter sp. VKM Ac-2879]MBF4503219.1 hypothetical protein [Rathayibacter sp. VKM Ac-2878]